MGKRHAHWCGLAIGASLAGMGMRHQPAMCMEDGMCEQVLSPEIIQCSSSSLDQIAEYGARPRWEFPESQWCEPVLTLLETTPRDYENAVPIIFFVPLNVEIPVAVFIRGLPSALCDIFFLGVVPEQ